MKERIGMALVGSLLFTGRRYPCQSHVIALENEPGKCDCATQTFNNDMVTIPTWKLA